MTLAVAVCGSHLFYRLKATKEYQVPIGLFEVLPQVNFERQFFIDEKPSYYEFANETVDMTGADVYAPPQTPAMTIPRMASRVPRYVC